MSFTVESKSQLAKLMATENLTVVHQKIPTAMIDIKSRTVYLPIWQDMSGFMYDLLTGHEVGHALYTPQEGLHNAVVLNNKGRNYKSFLNVVEDARIEKKIQRRYPGLKSSFTKAYSELFARDFFGLRGRSVNDLPFIDRLNIFTKSQYTYKTKFNDEEKVFVARAKALETWEQVVALADDIYAYSKVEQGLKSPEASQDKDTLSFGEQDDDEDFDPADGSTRSHPIEDDEDEAGESDENGVPDENGEPESDDGEGESDENESDETGENAVGAEEAEEKSSGETDSQQDPEFEPSCETDENYRENEGNLVDVNCKPYKYLNFPKPILKNIITPAARVQQLLSDHFKTEMRYQKDGKMMELVNKFKRKNERYVGLLAKEFEMRKAASKYAKAKISDTGDINVNKLATYKFDDNIFRKIMSVPNGKSHGLVLLLDYSGSMSRNMAGSIEQILVLTMFCRKVNIPFVVYAFGNNVNVRRIDSGLESYDWNVFMSSPEGAQWSKNEGDMEMSSLHLREYLSSDMNSKTYNQALHNMILLRESFIHGGYGFARPMSEQLSNTPLNEALIATASIMQEFKQRRKLDMTSLVVVHDGDADSVDYFIENGKRGFVDVQNDNVVFNDRSEKYQRRAVCNRKSYWGLKSQTMMENIMYWFKEVTGSKIVGFFIVLPTSSEIRKAFDERYYDKDGKSLRSTIPDYWARRAVLDTMTKSFKQEHFVQSKNSGYDDFYMILGGNEMLTENEEIEINGKVTANKLKNAFAKMNKKRTVSRVLVSKFIQQIAA
jgi:hypothetical protein